jgi:hypothetical protein
MVNSEDVMQIETLAGNDGPYRDYSFIWDYAPHEIAMILGLKYIQPKIEKVSIKKTGNFSGNCNLLLSFDDFSTASVKLWNDRLPKMRSFQVRVKDKVYIYNDQKSPSVLIVNGSEISVEYTKPLTNAVNTFIKAVQNKHSIDYRFGSHWGVQIASLIERIIYQGGLK